jgi:isopentenyl-diphosphate Delta-isomerase
LEKNQLMMEERVILVDEQDHKIGTMPKMEAHEKGLLHRAFSVFVFNDRKELMLQRRAWHKYHSPGLWTNTCCSHQRDGEDSLEAGHRRLNEEMGFDTALTFAVSFIYKAPFDNGLTEHELDHVLLGQYEGEPIINTEEVSEWKWMPMENLKIDLIEHPENYTVWFKIIFDKYCQHLES